MTKKEFMKMNTIFGKFVKFPDMKIFIKKKTRKTIKYGGHLKLMS